MPYFNNSQTAPRSLADCACGGGQQKQLSGYHTHRKHNLRGLRDEISDIQGQIQALRNQLKTALPGASAQIETQIKQLEDRARQIMNQRGAQPSGGNNGNSGEESWFTQQTLIKGVDNWVPVAVGGAAVTGIAYYAMS